MTASLRPRRPGLLAGLRLLLDPHAPVRAIKERAEQSPAGQAWSDIASALRFAAGELVGHGREPRVVIDDVDRPGELPVRAVHLLRHGVAVELRFGRPGAGLGSRLNELIESMPFPVSFDMGNQHDSVTLRRAAADGPGASEGVSWQGRFVRGAGEIGFPVLPDDDWPTTGTGGHPPDSPDSEPDG